MPLIECVLLFIYVQYFIKILKYLKLYFLKEKVFEILNQYKIIGDTKNFLVLNFSILFL